jgi:hypothetical protein
MTQIAAIATSLLKGEVLTIMNGYTKFACTNLPRELSRGIETKFNVIISRDKVKFTSQYGQPGFYYRYRLNKTPQNSPGIEVMKTYIRKEMGNAAASKSAPKSITATSLNQSQLF